MEYSIVPQNGWKNDFNKADPGAFFNDNHRKIDMVLAYEDMSETDEAAQDLESSLNIRYSQKLLGWTYWANSQVPIKRVYLIIILTLFAPYSHFFHPTKINE